MVKLILAVIATVASLAFSWVVFMANAMSDVTPHQFEGGWMLAGAWLATTAVWCWWFNDRSK